MTITLVIYLLLSLMVAYMGRRTRIGFYRALLFSLMLTPMIMLIYLLIFETVEVEVEVERRHTPERSGQSGRDVADKH